MRRWRDQAHLADLNIQPIGTKSGVDEVQYIRAQEKLGDAVANN
jgi:hypothetical protein